jgi:putative ABC transport system ATP-binding protein
MKIAINNLIYQYPKSDFTLRVESLSLAKGSRVAIVGCSGCGKTTLLRLLGGILIAEPGSLFLEEIDVASLSDSQRRALRIQSMGLVFQEFRLLEYLNVQENIRLPYRLHRSLDWGPEVSARRDALMARAAIAQLRVRKVGSLSTGERQRVAVCRALIAAPALILADEPTASLDSENKRRVQALLFSEAERCGATLIVATHDGELLDGYDHVIDLGAYQKGILP